MTPQFPQFKKIELSDKATIKSFTNTDKPYSDFDFTTLWMWDMDGVRAWTELDGNLVIRFTDYITREIFYSFFGYNNVEENIKKLMEFIDSEGLETTLRLVPESIIEQISAGGHIVSIEEDENNFDYVYTINNLVTYPGYSYSQQRKMMNRFVSRYEDVHVVPLDLKMDQEKIKKLTTIWEEGKIFGQYDEREAFERVLQKSDNFPLMSVGVLVGDDLVGFTINEIINEDFAISHFAKADISYTGIYSYLMRETANILAFQGCRFLNCEQDLGVPGLRKAKGSYRPEFFLKKYTIKYLSKN